MKRVFTKAVLFWVWVCVSPYSWGAKDYLALSGKLATLRVEIEGLNKELKEVQKKYSLELQSYSLQKAELRASIRKEQIKKEQLRSKIGKLRVDLSKGEQEDLKPLILTYADKLSEMIRKGLPFRKEERLANVQKIKKSLDKGDIGSYQALSRLWSAIEDEGRMARANQLSREKISIDGKTYLAEVALLGTVGLFFRLEDGAQGKAVLREGNWDFVTFTKREEIDASQKLFAGLKKQIKTGEYLVPTRRE